eukprot:983146-Pyramimonas_sp.AAC.1
MAAASSVPREVLRQAFVQQQQDLCNDPKSAAVSGPAGAVWKILAQLKWRAHSPFEWTTANGIQLDLTDDSPDWIRTLAR